MSYQTICNYPCCDKSNYPKLKVNPKDNTIVIKTFKDIYTREDLHSIAKEFFKKGLAQGRGNMEDRNDCNSFRIDSYIDENL